MKIAIVGRGNVGESLGWGWAAAGHIEVRGAGRRFAFARIHPKA